MHMRHLTQAMRLEIHGFVDVRRLTTDHDYTGDLRGALGESILTTAHVWPSLIRRQYPQCRSEEIAVETVLEATQQPETRIQPLATAIFDVRSMPLEALQTDAGARHMVRRILDRLDGSSRVNVAKFNSSI